MTTFAPEVGTELPPLRIDPISRTTPAVFAGSSDDRNPIHIAPDVARSAALDDVFARGSGTPSIACLGRLSTNVIPQQHLRSFRVRFASITPVHGQPTCTGTVTSIDEVTGERQATLDLKVSLPDGAVTHLGSAVIALG